MLTLTLNQILTLTPALSPGSARWSTLGVNLYQPPTLTLTLTVSLTMIVDLQEKVYHGVKWMVVPLSVCPGKSSNQRTTLELDTQRVD